MLTQNIQFSDIIYFFRLPQQLLAITQVFLLWLANCANTHLIIKPAARKDDGPGLLSLSIIASVQECQVLLILAKYHVLRILLHILVIRFARIGNGEHQLLPQHTLFFELVTIAVFRTLLCKYRYKEQQYKLVILVISKMQSLYIIRENTFIRMIKRDARRTVIIDAQHVAIL